MVETNSHIEPDFFLASSEGYGLQEPRLCKRIKRLHSDSRDDLLLVNVQPPVIGQRYGLGATDIDELLLATRYRGDSLFPITKWPVYVHVARLLTGEVHSRELIHENEFTSIGWAELYPTEMTAKKRKI